MPSVQIINEVADGCKHLRGQEAPDMGGKMRVRCDKRFSAEEWSYGPDVHRKEGIRAIADEICPDCRETIRPYLDDAY